MSLESDRHGIASPAQSIAALQEVLGLVLRQVQIEARAVILAPDFTEKLGFARMLTRDVGHAEALAGRISYLGGKADIAGVRTAGCPRKGCASERGCFRQCCADILATTHRALPALHPIWDGPSCDILTGVAADQEAKLAAEAQASDWSENSAAEPLTPGRSAAFVNPSPPPDWSDKPPLTRMTVEFLHFLLTRTEIPTIELCCSIICEFPEKPWELTVDLARQIADEVRHAQSCLDRLDALGGRVGQFSADVRIWRMTAPVGPELRIAMHQRIGEWIGVDALAWWANVFAQHGDVQTGAMLLYMRAEEINHVGLGVRWLRRLAGSEEGVFALHAEAERLRLAAGEDIGSKGRYPFDEWACRQAGLTEREIDHLRTLAQPASSEALPA
jgi:uncharacterized ferritin-like protein (DUF455 family)